MGYSPAAVLYIYFQPYDDSQSRLSYFFDCLGKWVKQPVSLTNGNLTIETILSIDNWSVLLPLEEVHRIAIYLTITYADGLHENVCLEQHRAFIFKLIQDHVVDVVHICCGLPKQNQRWFASRYEPGVRVGGRPYVALELLQEVLYSDLESLVKPINNLLENYWNELNKDREIVSIGLKERSTFLKSCVSLPYFNVISSTLNEAINRITRVGYKPVRRNRKLE